MKIGSIRRLNFEQNSGMNIVLLTAMFLTFVTACVAQNGQAQGHGNGGAFAIGLWGDLPYSSVQATVGVTNLIPDTNLPELVFKVHGRDAKRGVRVCSDSVYRHCRSYLNSRRAL